MLRIDGSEPSRQQRQLLPNRSIVYVGKVSNHSAQQPFHHVLSSSFLTKENFSSPRLSQREQLEDQLFSPLFQFSSLAEKAVDHESWPWGAQDRYFCKFMKVSGYAEQFGCAIERKWLYI